MTDYLEAYLRAALDEARLEDERFREAVEARAREIVRTLERPYREAMRLQALSKGYRAELTDRIAAGESAQALFPLAMETISALCGDEAFARHNLARMQQAAGENSAGQGDLKALERRDLEGRRTSLLAFIEDGSVPEGERAQARLRLKEIEARLGEL